MYPPLHEQLGDFFDWFERHLKLLNDRVRVRPSQFALYPSHRAHQELRSPYVCKKPLSSAKFCSDLGLDESSPMELVGIGG